MELMTRRRTSSGDRRYRPSSKALIRSRRCTTLTRCFRKRLDLSAGHGVSMVDVAAVRRQLMRRLSGMDGSGRQVACSAPELVCSCGSSYQILPTLKSPGQGCCAVASSKHRRKRSRYQPIPSRKARNATWMKLDYRRRRRKRPTVDSPAGCRERDDLQPLRRRKSGRKNVSVVTGIERNYVRCFDDYTYRIGMTTLFETTAAMAA